MCQACVHAFVNSPLCQYLSMFADKIGGGDLTSGQLPQHSLGCEHVQPAVQPASSLHLIPKLHRSELWECEAKVTGIMSQPSLVPLS